MPRDYLPRFALGPAEYAAALYPSQTYAVACPMLSGSMWSHHAPGFSETVLRTDAVCRSTLQVFGMCCLMLL